MTEVREKNHSYHSLSQKRSRLRLLRYGMIRNTPNFVFFFSRFAKTVGSSKTIFDFLATDFSEWTRVNSRRIFAVYADLLSTRSATRTPNSSSSSCYTRAFTRSRFLRSPTALQYPAVNSRCSPTGRKIAFTALLTRVKS